MLPKLPPSTVPATLPPSNLNVSRLAASAAKFWYELNETGRRFKVPEFAPVIWQMPERCSVLTPTPLESLTVVGLATEDRARSLVPPPRSMATLPGTLVVGPVTTLL